MIQARNVNTSSFRDILFNGSTSNTVTMSESAINYNRLRIFFRGSGATFNSVDVYSPNGKTVWLLSGNVENNGTIWMGIKQITISGNTISNTSTREVSISTSSVNNSNSNVIYIVRVEGWNV